MAYVVIGANYGDEGKGTITNYLFSRMTNKSPALNVRYSGGANAGHTVGGENEYVKRHVFHHFGSGSFHAFVETFLSKDFICNPFIFEKELKELHEKEVFPRVYVDIDSVITTPYDIMINQILEEHRGEQRHGSCGLGINETIVRSETKFRFSLNDIRTREGLWNVSKIIKNISQDYVPQRFKDLGIPVSDIWKTRLESEDVLLAYLQSLDTFYHNIHIVDFYPDFLRRYDSDRIVFEGSQGLLLDQNHKFFPHVTRANTGIKNVVNMAHISGLTNLEVIYASRPYMTRHGAGPFPSERFDISYEDKTNIPNDWQGTLRFGMLDIDLLAESITHDLSNNDARHVKPVEINHGIALTCLDQIDNGVDFIVNNKIEHGGVAEICKAIRSKGLKIFYGNSWRNGQLDCHHVYF